MNLKMLIFAIFFYLKSVIAIVDLTRDFSEECIKAHNVKRRLHNASDLVYGDELSGHAENGSYESALKAQMILPEKSQYGQNIAYSTIQRNCEEVVDLWYKDSKFYDFDKPTFKIEAGAFTQLVWKLSQRIACSQHSENNDEYYTVCVYDPPGNVQDKNSFEANVSPSNLKSIEENSDSIDMNTSSIIDLTTQTFQKNCLQAHNKFRKVHQVDDLVYDPKLLNYAKKKAFIYALKGEADYSSNQFGQNSLSRTRPLFCDYAIDRWYNQKRFYDFNSPKYYKDATAFIQLVWKSTKRFACASAQNKNDLTKYYLTCIYYPIGLVRHQYLDNILPASKLFEKLNTTPMTTSEMTTSSLLFNQEVMPKFYGYSMSRYGAG